jgi:hypothetical protein
MRTAMDGSETSWRSEHVRAGGSMKRSASGIERFGTRLASEAYWRRPQRCLRRNLDFPPLVGHRGYAARVDGCGWS